MKLAGYQQSTWLCVKMEFVWLEPFRFHVNCYSLSKAVFVHVGSPQLRTENGVVLHVLWKLPAG